MVRSKFAALTGAILLSASAAQAAWYTSEASFVSAIDPTFYLEDFSNFSFGNPLNGSQTTWAAPGANGYGWTAAAALGLYANSSALSTNTANDPMILTFTGAPVTAFGGIVSNTDITGANIPGTVTLLMSNGDTQSITFPTAAQGFLGWTGPSPIASVTMDAISGATNNWVQLDHSYTGALSVPEPVSCTGLAMGACALLRRRRKA